MILNTMIRNKIPSILNNFIKDRKGLIRFPVTKIKNISKLDNEIKLCQKNAYLVIGKLTEMFIQQIATESVAVAKIKKRKTLNIEDICIPFNF